MKILIVHDSAYGNGERLAKILQKAFEEEGHHATVGHVKELSPESAAEEPPEMLILGAAIRKFRSSPASKKWLRRFAGSVSRKPEFAALFITHGLPLSWADRWGRRLLKKLRRSGVAERYYGDWLSGRVTNPEGPLEEGTEVAFREHATALLEAAVQR